MMELVCLFTRLQKPRVRIFMPNSPKPCALDQVSDFWYQPVCVCKLPAGYEAQVRPRSGLAVKYGITCLNSPGTIDSDYRGELKVLLVNLGAEAFDINDGERIAQLVVAPVVTADFMTSRQTFRHDPWRGRVRIDRQIGRWCCDDAMEPYGVILPLNSFFHSWYVSCFFSSFFHKSAAAHG
jgi:hypothetical protein